MCSLPSSGSGPGLGAVAHRQAGSLLPPAGHQAESVHSELLGCHVAPSRSGETSKRALQIQSHVFTRVQITHFSRLVFALLYLVWPHLAIANTSCVLAICFQHDDKFHSKILFVYVSREREQKQEKSSALKHNSGFWFLHNFELP